MSFTKVAPAGIGTEPGNSILIGDSLLHSTGIDLGHNTGIGVTIRKHGDATFTGIVTASAFFGDGSGLEGVSSSGIGTALSDDDTNPLNKVYYVNQELSIGSTVTVNHPDSAVASYTHYQDLVVKNDADFIVADGDTFIPDVLGIRTSTSPTSSATGGRIRAGTITNAGANGAPNFPNGLTGTAGTFTGSLNVGGVLTYEDVTNIDSVGIITARTDVLVGSTIKLGASSGIITATSFRGDASQMTGAGLGTDGSANTSGIITATAFVPTTGQLSHRNIVINGAMKVSQRGDFFGNVGQQEYTIDQFVTLHSYGNVINVTQTSTSPDGFSKAYKVDCQVADTSIGAAEFMFIRHKIEAQNLQQLAYGTSGAKSITLSFYVRSTVTGTYAICLQQKDNSSKQVNGTYTINSANTWERKTFTFAGDTSGVINDDNGHGLDILWTLVAGSNRTSGSARPTWTAHADADESFGHTANVLSSTSNDWLITGVQLEVGPVATPFEHRPYNDELLRCQRYFTFVPSGTVFPGRGNSSSSYIYSYQSTVPMRSSPTTIGTSNSMAHGTFSVRRYRDGTGTSDSTSTPTTNSVYFSPNTNMIHLIQGGFSGADDRSATLFVSGGAITISAEL